MHTSLGEHGGVYRVGGGWRVNVLVPGHAAALNRNSRARDKDANWTGWFVEEHGWGLGYCVGNTNPKTLFSRLRGADRSWT